MNLNQHFRSKFKTELKAIHISGNSERIFVSRIELKPEYQNKGIGSKIMQELVIYADQTNSMLFLSPEGKDLKYTNFLIKFYKKFGFVENRGRNRDYTTLESMIRYPNKEKHYVA